MRFRVDPWDPGYGTSADEAWRDDGAGEIEASTEMPLAAWEPIKPAGDPSGHVTVIDGVRRIEARLWIDAETGGVPGVCASWAAGSVRCTPIAADLHEVVVGRSLAAPLPLDSLEPVSTRVGSGGEVVYQPVSADGPQAEQLWLAVQGAMGAAERAVAQRAIGCDEQVLVVVDGPLRGRDHSDHLVGLVKTHHVRYLDGRAAAVLGTLRAGERTPVFTLGGPFGRHSWYVRLPSVGGDGVPMAGVVRCEMPTALAGTALTAHADRVALELARLASEPHKDRRAPQNLYPIAGLERLLRHRLGDAALLYRALCKAAHLG